MTEQHPMVPSNILLNNWESDWEADRKEIDYLLTEAYQAGADAELEACIDVLGGQWEWDMLSQCTGWKEFRALSEEILRDARRPKLKTLKQQALQELDKVDMLWCTEDFDQVSQKALETIRRAIESIPDPS